MSQEPGLTCRKLPGRTSRGRPRVFFFLPDGGWTFTHFTECTASFYFIYSSIYFTLPPPVPPITQSVSKPKETAGELHASSSTKRQNPRLHLFSRRSFRTLITTQSHYCVYVCPDSQLLPFHLHFRVLMQEMLHLLRVPVASFVCIQLTFRACTPESKMEGRYPAFCSTLWARFSATPAEWVLLLISQMCLIWGAAAGEQHKVEVCWFVFLGFGGFMVLWFYGFMSAYILNLPLQDSVLRIDFSHCFIAKCCRAQISLAMRGLCSSRCLSLPASWLLCVCLSLD